MQFENLRWLVRKTNDANDGVRLRENFASCVSGIYFVHMEMK